MVGLKPLPRCAVCLLRLCMRGVARCQLGIKRRSKNILDGRHDTCRQFRQVATHTKPGKSGLFFGCACQVSTGVKKPAVAGSGGFGRCYAQSSSLTVAADLEMPKSSAAELRPPPSDSPSSTNRTLFRPRETPLFPAFEYAKAFKLTRT